MPEIERKKHEIEKQKAEDVIVKVGKIRLYFQNYYTILSLGNDLLLGGLYYLGSLVTVCNGPEWARTYSYLAGAFFMLTRPILKIFRNIFIYNEQEFQDKIVNSTLFDDALNKKAKNNTHQKRQTDQSQYGGNKTQQEKRERIKESEHD